MSEESKKGTELIIPQHPLVLKEDNLQIMEHNLKLLQKMVKQVLVADEDYAVNLFPGQKRAVLLDPGSAKICNYFNLITKYDVLEHDVPEMEGRIRYLLQVTLLTRDGQSPVATGIASSSSQEIKYGYRWVEDPENYGYSSDEKLKTRRDRRFNKESKKWEDVLLYRIENPDIGDLDNTLVKMAAKRGEIDAVMKLPGVAGIFTQDLQSPPKSPEIKPPEEKNKEPTPEDKLKKLRQQAGIEAGKVFKTEEERKAWQKQEYGVDSITELTEEQLNNMLTKVRGIKAKEDLFGKEPVKEELATAEDQRAVIKKYRDIKGWGEGLDEIQKQEVRKFFLNTTGKTKDWTKIDIEKIDLAIRELEKQSKEVDDLRKLVDDL